MIDPEKPIEINLTGDADLPPTDPDKSPFVALPSPELTLSMGVGSAGKWGRLPFRAQLPRQFLRKVQGR